MNCFQGFFTRLKRRGFRILCGEAAQIGVQRSQQRKMGGEAEVHVFGERFVIRVGGAVSVFEHNQPSGFVPDPPVLIREFEAALGRLAIEPFQPRPLLNHFPSQLEAELKALDGGVAGEVCFRSAEGFAETKNSCGEAIEPGRHKGIP